MNWPFINGCHNAQYSGPAAQILLALWLKGFPRRSYSTNFKYWNRVSKQEFVYSHETVYDWDDPNMKQLFVYSHECLQLYAEIQSTNCKETIYFLHKEQLSSSTHLLIHSHECLCKWNRDELGLGFQSTRSKEICNFSSFSHCFLSDCQLF